MPANSQNNDVMNVQDELAVPEADSILCKDSISTASTMELDDMSDASSSSPKELPDSPASSSAMSDAERSDSPQPVIKTIPDTVIIFDWDDTLLASSFLSSEGYRLDSTTPYSDDLKDQLQQLEKSVISVLELALQYGEVHVITNAETGWVQLSAQKFIPGVLPLLNRVTVISARSTYERLYPDAPLKWKYHAFHERLTTSFQECKSPKNIISFGDSHVEREAVRTVSRNFPNAHTKSVKFAERPSMLQLRRQIELVMNCMQSIHTHEGDLDLMLTISMMY